MMKTIFLTLFFLLMQSAFAHVEIIGEFLMETDGQKLFLTATVGKRHHTLALMNEVDCTPKEMMQKCGSEYILDHYTVKINGEEIRPTLVNTEINQTHVVYHFELDIHPENIEKINVKSDYIMKYNDHAVLRTAIVLGDCARSFDINKDRNTITANY